MTVEKWQLHLQKVLVSLHKLKKAKDYFAAGHIISEAPAELEKLEKGERK